MGKPIREYRIEHLQEEASKVDRSKNIHVTDLSRCLAGVWQEKTGRAKVEHNESKLRRFDAGHIIESRVLEALESKGVLHSAQGSLDWPELNMTGSYDMIINEDDGMWLVEVKSIHPYGISHLYKSNKVHEHYLEQVNLYLSKLREEYPEIKARIYYEALDGRTFEQEIKYNQLIVEKALEKAKTLKKAIDTDTMPDPPEIFVKENNGWKLNWRVEYCLTSGLHQKCDPKTAIDPDPEKCISKLKYQSKKLNNK